MPLPDILRILGLRAPPERRAHHAATRRGPRMCHERPGRLAPPRRR